MQPFLFLMQKFNFIAGSALAGISVILGAFGAHALKARITAEQLQVFHTGVNYQFYHAIALLITALMMDKIQSTLLNYAGIAFFLGTLFFSGSLYLLSTASINGLASLKPVLGPITPLGGLSFIVGWTMLVLAIVKTKI